MRRLLLSVFVTTLVACQGAVPPPQRPTTAIAAPPEPAKGTDGIACVGAVANQVFIPNEPRAGQVFVEDCSPGAPWP